MKGITSSAKYPSRLLIVSIVILAFTVSLLLPAQAIGVDEVLRLGKPVVLRIPVEGATFSYVDGSTGKVVVVYSLKGVQVAGYLLPTQLSKVEISYPLQGELSLAAYSSKPSAEYVAFATSLGEIVVLSSSGNKVSYGYIQAKDESPVKLRVSQTGSIAVSFNDASMRVYKINRGGWYEIGPLVGNTSAWFKSGISIFSMEMLEELQGNSTIYNDVLAVYESVEEYPSYLNIRVMRYNLTELIPVPGVNVFAYVEDLDVYTPTIRTRGDGSALLPIPVPANNMTIYVQDVNGTCYGFSLRNLGFTERGHTYTLPSPLILRDENITTCPTPTKTVQLVFYRIGENGLGEIGKPIVLAVGGSVSLDAFVKPSLPGLQWTYLVLSSGVFPTLSGEKVLLFRYMGNDLKTKYVTWIPIKADVTSTAFTSDGKYMAVGLSDGLIMVFHLDPVTGLYKALWSYRLPNAITAMEFSRQIGHNTAVRGLLAIDSHGFAQLIAINTTHQIPLMRLGDTPAFATGRGTTVSMNSNANEIAISGSDAVFLVFGLGDAATSSPVKPVDVWNYVLQRLVLRVKEEDGTPVKDALVQLYRPGEIAPLFTLRTNATGFAVVNYILPGNYLVKITPEQYWLKPLQQEIRVEPRSENVTQKLDLTLRYKPVLVKMSLTDSFTGEAPEEKLYILVYRNITGAPPANITNITVPVPPMIPLNITGAILVHNITVDPGTSNVSFTLIKGKYRATIIPANPVDTVYRAVNIDLKIPGNETINITLPRKLRQLKIVLVDSKTSKAIEEPVSITVSWHGLTLYNGRMDAGQSILTINVPVKGGVKIDVIPLPPGGELPLYEDVSRIVTTIPPEGTTTIIVLKRRLIPVTLTILDRDTNDVPLVPLKVTIDNSDTRILQKGENVLSLKLDKGRHIITIDPLPAFGPEKIPLYSSKTVVLDVKSLISKTVYLDRIYSQIVITVVDSLTKGMPIDKIEVYANKTLLGAVTKKTGNTISRYILKGKYDISAVSIKNIYQPFKQTVDLKNNTVEMRIELKRKLITVNLKILDDTGAPITGAKVTATGIDVSFTSQSTSVEGLASLTLPYGTYRICVATPGYSKYCKTVSAAEAVGRQIPVILQPLPQTLLQRYLPLIIVIVVIGVIMAVIYRQRERILKAIAPEEEVF